MILKPSKACLYTHTSRKRSRPTKADSTSEARTRRGQIPDLPGNFQLIDKDTPSSAYTYKAYEGGDELELVFSDEFNTDGRSFYPGDDPFWEAVDLHYWGTVRSTRSVPPPAAKEQPHRMMKNGMTLLKVRGLDLKQANFLMTFFIRT